MVTKTSLQLLPNKRAIEKKRGQLDSNQIICSTINEVRKNSAKQTYVDNILDNLG